MDEVFVVEHCIFQHDLASAHASKSIKSSLDNSGLDVMKRQPNSPIKMFGWI